MIFLLIYCLIFSLTSVVESALKEGNCGYTAKSLPTAVKSHRYSVDLKVLSDQTRYQGYTEAVVFIKEPNDDNVIRLRIDPEIEIQSIRVRGRIVPQRRETSSSIKRIPYPLIDSCLDRDNELISLTIDRGLFQEAMRTLESSTVVKSLFLYIHIEHINPIRVQGYGLLHTSYINPEGELVDAFYVKSGRNKGRYLFPCLDDPRNFGGIEITVYLHPGQTAHGLSSIGSHDYVNGLRQVKFNRVIVKLHQLAMVFGKIEKATTLNDKLPTLILPIGEPMSTKEQIVKFMCDVYEDLKDFFKFHSLRSNYIIVALPNIGPDGINGRTISIMDLDWLKRGAFDIDTERVSRFVMKLVDNIARQWLGNFISIPSPWDSWLMEALVYQLMLTKGPNPIDYRTLMRRFILEEYHQAMEIDSNPSKSPLINISDRYKDYFRLLDIEISIIENMSDHLPDTKYTIHDKVKCFGLLRTIMDRCNPGVTEIVRDELVHYNSGYLRSRDFVGIIDRICEWDPSEVIISYLSQPGHPLISVDIDSSKKVVIIKQERMRSDYTLPDQSFPSLKWTIPVSIRFYDDQNNIKQMKLDVPSSLEPMIIDIPMEGSDKIWVKLNNGSAGFYRVQYSNLILDRMKEAFKTNKIMDELDQLNIITDALALFRSGKVGAPYLVKIIEILSNTESDFVLEAIVDGFMEIRQVYADTPFETATDKLCLNILSHIVEREGVKAAPVMSDRAKSTRGRIYSLLVNFGYRKLIDWSNEQFDTDHLDPIQLSTYFASLSINGSDIEYADLMRYIRWPLLEKSTRCGSMAVTRKHYRLHRFWQKIKQGRSDQMVDYLQMLSINPEGRQFLGQILQMEPETISGLIGQVDFIRVLMRYCTVRKGAICELNSSLSNLFTNDIWKQVTENIQSLRRKRLHIQRLDQGRPFY